jgi:hypothetical protein
MKEIQIHPAPHPGAPAPIAGRCRRERKCIARRTVRISFYLNGKYMFKH